MFKTIFKVAFKIMLALGAVFAALAFLQYLDSRKNNYIEIYNEDDDEYGEELYG